MSEGRSTASRSKMAVAVFLGAVALAPALPAAENPGWELREFAISIDNHQAGRYRMEISPQPDGSVLVSSQAKVLLNYLIFRYTYQFAGTERWHNGCLVSLNSKSNDDGKKFQVNAVAHNNDIRVTVNGSTSAYRGDVWTTTYWQLPDPHYRDQGVPLLDADTGRYLAGTLRFIDRENLTILGKPEVCTHYHISAPGIDVDAWYDAEERLVRQTAREDGHKTVLLLYARERR